MLLTATESSLQKYFWILWKTLSLDYQRQGKIIILKSKFTDIKQRKNGADILTNFDKVFAERSLSP